MVYCSISSLPETVDGGDGESHDGGHAPHNEDGHPHDPHDLVLASLEFKKVCIILMSYGKKYKKTPTTYCTLYARIAFVT
jgi:hypothetical protein